MSLLGSSVVRSEWLCGIVGGFDLAKSTTLMAKLYCTSRMNFSRDVLILDFGLRHKFTENYILIVSMDTREGLPVVLSQEATIAFHPFFSSLR
jgi:hypothetical protein